MGKSLKEILAEKQKALAAKEAAFARTTKFANGNNLIVIMPGWRGDGDETFFHDFGMHYVKEGTSTTAHVCLEKTFGKECPICSSISKAMSYAEDEDTVKLVKSFGASQRYLVNAAAVAKNGAIGDAAVYEFTGGAFSTLIDLVQDWPDLLIPEDGKIRPLVVKREGTGINTTYTVSPFNKLVPFSDDDVKGLVDLDAMVNQENETKAKDCIAKITASVGILPPKMTPSLADESSKRLTAAFEESEVEEADFEDVNLDPKSEVVSDDELDDLDSLLDDIEEA